MWTGPLFSHGLVGDWTYSELITPKQFKLALKQIQNGDTQNLVQIKNGLWSTNCTLKLAYEWCCFDKCSFMTNFLIEKGHIFTMYGDAIATDLGDVGSCRARDGICVTEEGIIIWHAPNLTSICPYSVKGTYHAEVVG